MAARLLAALLATLVVPTAALAAKPRPDLWPAPPRILGGSEVVPGGTLRVTDAVRNRGRRRAPATVSRFVLSGDRTAGEDDVVLGRRAVAALRRGRTSRRTLALRVPASARPGLWHLIVCADARRRVRERRERDNCRAATLPFRLSAPPEPEPPPAEQSPPAESATAAPVEPQALPLPLLAAPAQPGPRPTGPASIKDCEPDIPADDAPAEEFTAMFAATEKGWTGGDATLSARLPDG